MKKEFKYPKVNHNGRSVEKHIQVAEKAFGGPLPPGSVVHHVDEDPYNNAGENLVVCPGHAYHKLLHRRAAAYDACGNASYVLCIYCRQYGPPDQVIYPKRSNGEFSGGHHKSCKAAADRARHLAKKEKLQ